MPKGAPGTCIRGPAGVEHLSAGPTGLATHERMDVKSSVPRQGGKVGVVAAVSPVPFAASVMTVALKGHGKISKQCTF